MHTTFKKTILVSAIAVALAACEGDDVSDGMDGANGAPGADGLTSLIAQTVLPAGDSNCPEGGTQVDSGIDANGNGTLEADEVDATSFVCNGVGGSVIDIARVQQLLETNADIARALYLDSVDTAQALSDAIDAFADDRSQANLDAAKMAWLVAREPYGQTEVYRFRLSPIDSTDYSEEDGPEGDINAWPLGEALIDYVVTNDGTLDDFEFDQVGITESATPINAGGEVRGTEMPAINIIASDVPITEELISGTATADDERDVIAGYHAIEFLLWGQDLNNNGEVTTGADRELAVKTSAAPNLAMGGQRPLADFTTNPGADRRIEYLQVAVAKLIADLQGVADGWEDGVSGNYRDQFTTITSENNAKVRLAQILTGMGTLSEGELAGERMQIAFSANSQEDEHSCFADNTHRDILLNYEGIANSFYGDYSGYDANLNGVDDDGDNTARAVSGYGFDDYAAEVGRASLMAVADALDAALTVTAGDVGDIDAAARAGSPVDVLIQDANRTDPDNPMRAAILSLNAQSAQIAALADALEIDDTVVDDDASGCDTTNPDSECG
ncbi:MAG: imelysin family protein [Pseudomonadota bacterium]